MNIHEHGNRYDLPTLTKISHSAPPGCRIGIGPSSPHDQKVPSATVRLGTEGYGRTLKGPKVGWRAVFFLEMKQNAGIFSSIYNSKKKYYTWDFIICKCYYILLWFSVVIIIIIIITVSIIIIKIIDDSKNWGDSSTTLVFPVTNPIWGSPSYFFFSPRQESPKTWGKDAGLVVLEPSWKK